MHYAHITNNIVDFVLRVPPHSIFASPYAGEFIEAPENVEVGWLWDGEQLTPPPIPEVDITTRQNAAWEAIKAERDKRKVAGVKVGSHWFHSDDSSRIQQIALVMMGNSIPAGLMWKTLTLTPPPVFVEMTPALAQGIFQATAASDAAIFSAAETHRVAMENSPTPETYDFSTGWPVAIWEE